MDDTHPSRTMLKPGINQNFHDVFIARYCKLENRCCNVTKTTLLKAFLQPPINRDSISKADYSTENHDENDQLNNGMLKKFRSEQKEKGSLQDVATAVSVERAAQTNLGPFPLERAGSICPDTVCFDFVAYCCKCCKMLQSLIAGWNCRNRHLEQVGQRKIWMIRTLQERLC